MPSVDEQEQLDRFLDGFRPDLLYLNTYGEETLYIPAKLYDYLLAGRPVLCETSSPETAAILRRTGSGPCVPPGDVEGMLCALERAKPCARGPIAEQRRAGEAFAQVDAHRIERSFAEIERGERRAHRGLARGTVERPRDVRTDAGGADGD